LRFLYSIVFSAALFPAYISSFSQTAGDFRTVASGPWATVANWERYNGVAWVAAIAIPTSADGIISIRNTHTINVGTLTIDQVVIDPGGVLFTPGGMTTTINNGAGPDITVNGTLHNNVVGGTVTWNPGATWIFGANGTLILSNQSPSNSWQTTYDGGASTMPATANWRVEKLNGSNPGVSTIGAYYPNYYIENYTITQWVTGIGSSFTGAGGYPTIKGNFYVGGAGTGTVDFLNDNTNATPVQVWGDMIVAVGSNARNYGTGYNVQGNITVNGTVTYDVNDARGITLSGPNNQTVNGAGAFAIWNFTVNKSANNVTLNRAITVDNQLTLTSGLVYSTAVNILNMNNNATVAAVSNASFVSGPVRKYGIPAFTFPIGKGSAYRSAGVSAVTTATAFYTEGFGSGCSTGTLATSYGGWTMSSTGTNEAFANTWYVSAEENGNAVNACGSVCGTNRTLHLGSTLLGDLGAAYFESDPFSCSFLAWCAITNRRIESPVISCAGRSNIVLNFKYMEAGDGTLDNATLWYYNGVAWSQIVDMAKTALTCAPQGIWTAYSIQLPVSANNNPNVRIGFNWTNNGDGIASDPSFAVDDITLNCDAVTAEYFWANPQTTFNNVLAPTLAQISLVEYWQIDRTNGTNGRNVTLSWDINSGVSNMAALRVARWDLAVWQNEGNTGTTGANPAGTITSANVVTFSPFTLSSSIPVSPLPIELISFYGKLENDAVNLSWKTLSETDNDFFTVQKSADGTQFSDIGIVDGAGTSSLPHDYFFSDREPFEGTSYYRLKQTDLDETFSYSEIISIENTNSGLDLISVMSDPEYLEIHLSCTCKTGFDLEILDMQGKAVYRKHHPSFNSENIIKINSSGFSEGIYLVKVSDERNILLRKVKI